MAQLSQTTSTLFLLPLDARGRFRRDIVKHAADSFDLVEDLVGVTNVQKCEMRELTPKIALGMSNSLAVFRVL